MDFRYQMICEYLDELGAIKGLPPQTAEEKQAFYAEVTGDERTQWIDIRENGKDIGFLIVGTRPNCHPDADFYMEEAYIRPAFRRKKHMVKTVSRFVRKNGGVYCLFILHGNEAAKQFWEETFVRLGYLPCCLPDVGAEDEFCTQYGFKPGPMFNGANEKEA